MMSPGLRLSLTILAWLNFSGSAVFAAGQINSGAAPVGAPAAVMAPAGIPAFEFGLGPRLPASELRGSLGMPNPGLSMAPAAQGFPASAVLQDFQPDISALLQRNKALSIGRDFVEFAPPRGAGAKQSPRIHDLDRMTRRIDAELGSLSKDSSLESQSRTARRLEDILTGRESASAAGLDASPPVSGEPGSGRGSGGGPFDRFTMSNPAELYPMALHLAETEARKRGRNPQQLYFGQAVAPLGFAPDEGWRFTFYLTEDPNAQRADEAVVEFYRPSSKESQLSRPVAYHGNVYVPQGMRLKKFTPRSYAEHSLIAVEEAKALAQVRGMPGARVEQRLDQHMPDESGLWYYFYDDFGLHGAVNARSGEARNYSRAAHAPEPSRGFVRYALAAAMAALALIAVFFTVAKS